MEKTVKALLAAFLFTGLLQGCSMNKNETTGKENQSDTNNVANDVKDDVEDSIDNVMNFFNDKKVELENMQPIENMEFAAYEGKSFEVNGKTAYLYRVKSNDEKMKKVLKEAKDKGKVRVNIKNKEMEYNAKVNGNFLLLYDPNADMNDVLTTFEGYTRNVTPNDTNGRNAKDTTNTTTSDGTSGNAKTNDPTTGNTTSGNQNGDVNNNGKTNSNNTNTNENTMYD